MSENLQILLRQRPVGLPGPETFEAVTAPIPTPGPGEALVRVLYLSLDPAMRGWMNDTKSYIAPVGLGQVMRGGTLAEVVSSNDPRLAPGDIVEAMAGWQRYAALPAAHLRKIATDTPLPAALGVLSATGLTAYFGLFDVGKPQPGQTVVVSGAAGAVGSIVVQLAKIHGCRVVGIAGSAEKCAWLRELGADAAINYRDGEVGKALRAACPQGIDVFFDNVGGDILDAALARLARGARIVICGAISQYNATGAVQGPKNYLSLLVNRARMEGMVVFDYAARYGEAVAEMSAYLKDGRMKSREDVVRGGVAAFPGTLLKLFSGENFGKLVLDVAKA